MQFLSLAALPLLAGLVAFGCQDEETDPAPTKTGAPKEAETSGKTPAEAASLTVDLKHALEGEQLDAGALLVVKIDKTVATWAPKEPPTLKVEGVGKKTLVEVEGDYLGSLHVELKPGEMRKVAIPVLPKAPKDSLQADAEGVLLLVPTVAKTEDGKMGLGWLVPAGAANAVPVGAPSESAPMKKMLEAYAKDGKVLVVLGSAPGMRIQDLTEEARRLLGAAGDLKLQISTAYVTDIPPERMDLSGGSSGKGKAPGATASKSPGSPTQANEAPTSPEAPEAEEPKDSPTPSAEPAPSWSTGRYSGAIMTSPSAASKLKLATRAIDPATPKETGEEAPKAEGEGVGLGNIGTLGHGSAGPSTTTGDSQSGTPSYLTTRKVRTSATQVEGVGGGQLPAEVVRRIVRQHNGRFRRCYDTALGKNPDLEGIVSVHFAIGRDGSVSNVKDHGSSMADSALVSCTRSAFYGMSFPAPEGGIVLVTYSLTFSVD